MPIAMVMNMTASINASLLFGLIVKKPGKFIFRRLIEAVTSTERSRFVGLTCNVGAANDREARAEMLLLTAAMNSFAN